MKGQEGGEAEEKGKKKKEKKGKKKEKKKEREEGEGKKRGGEEEEGRGAEKGPEVRRGRAVNNIASIYVFMRIEAENQISLLSCSCPRCYTFCYPACPASWKTQSKKAPNGRELECGKPLNSLEKGLQIFVCLDKI